MEKEFSLLIALDIKRNNKVASSYFLCQLFVFLLHSRLKGPAAVRNIHRTPTEILNHTYWKYLVSSEMSGDPKNYFRFTFDEFTKYTVNIAQLFEGTIICETLGHSLK